MRYSSRMSRILAAVSIIACATPLLRPLPVETWAYGVPAHLRWVGDSQAAGGYHAEVQGEIEKDLTRENAQYFTDVVRTAALKAQPQLEVITRENLLVLLQASG